MAERIKNNKERAHVNSTYTCPDCEGEGAEPGAIVHASACSRVARLDANTR